MGAIPRYRQSRSLRARAGGLLRKLRSPPAHARGLRHTASIGCANKYTYLK
ncbi:MAG: hypothetical protein MUE85_19805 [Microscillaceae bacterium]|nr:hypothetical protein [Microscillaceae bacterium]